MFTLSESERSISKSLVSSSGTDLPMPPSLLKPEVVKFIVRDCLFEGMIDPVEIVPIWKAMVESSNLLEPPLLGPPTLFLRKIRLLKTTRRVLE